LIDTNLLVVLIVGAVNRERIASFKRTHTDDLDLYLALSHEGLPVINFAHLQEQEWGN